MYPTKQQIITSLPDINIPKNIIKILQIWKREHWDIIEDTPQQLKEWKFQPFEKNSEKMKRIIKSHKRKKIRLLLDILGKTLKIKINKVEFDHSKKSFCIPEIKTIILGNQPISIISTLHEFAHLLLGINETKACAWSIKLFKEAFPKEFKKLKWNGHKLIKRKKYERTNTKFN